MQNARQREQPTRAALRSVSVIFTVVGWSTAARKLDFSNIFTMIWIQLLSIQPSQPTVCCLRPRCASSSSSVADCADFWVRLCNACYQFFEAVSVSIKIWFQKSIDEEVRESLWLDSEVTAVEAHSGPDFRVKSTHSSKKYSKVVSVLSIKNRNY